MAKPPVTRRHDIQGLTGVKSLKRRKKNKVTVLYGGPGTGKTTLAATWPTPILMVNCRDDGLDSIQDMTEEEVKFIDVESVADMKRLIEELKAGKGDEFKTIAIDTFTHFQEVIVEEIARDNKVNLKGKRAGDFGTLQKQDWGKVSTVLKDTITDFKDLDREVVFLCQQKAFNLEDNEDLDEQLAPEIGPRLMPSVAALLNAAAGTLGQTFIRVRQVKEEDKKTKKIKRIEKKEFCLRVGPSSLYITKVRRPEGWGAPPDFIVNPTYEKVLAVINGEED